jgi:hypothetical protein
MVASPGNRETGPLTTPRLPALGALLATVACSGTLSPLSNRIRIGEEAYFVFVADVPGGEGELFAAPAGGGTAFQFTFTRLDERSPSLSPDGATVAFLRAAVPEDSLVSVWVMNLLSGAERQITSQQDLAARALAWSADGRILFIRTASAILATPAPPEAPRLAPVAAENAAADSAFMVLAGDPPVARIETCRQGTGLCAERGRGEEFPLDAGGADPVRWGADSVGYLLGTTLVVRPLGGGQVREIRWARVPNRLREVTYFPGTKPQ